MICDELDLARRKVHAEQAVKVLNRALPADVEFPNWPWCERLVPHALIVLDWIKSEDLRLPEAAQLLNQTGYYLYLRARYKQGDELFRQALKIDEAVLRPDHPHTALVLNNLAVLLRIRGFYKEGEELCRRALEIRECDSAISLNNLALLLQAQGRTTAAV